MSPRCIKLTDNINISLLISFSGIMTSMVNVNPPKFANARPNLSWCLYLIVYLLNTNLIVNAIDGGNVK